MDANRRSPSWLPSIPRPACSSSRLRARSAASMIFAGKAVALGTRASGLTVIGRTVLQGSGIDPDHGIKPVLLDHAGAGAGLVLDGTVAALWGAGFDWPSFKVLAEAPGAQGSERRFVF